MTRTQTSWPATLGFLGCFLALGGCYSAVSEVPAVTETSRAGPLPLQPGRYCAPADEDEDGLLDLETGACITVEVGEGMLTIISEDPENPGPFPVDVAELPRDAWLAQVLPQGEERYELFIVLLAKEAAAILELGEQTSDVESLARKAGVTLATRRPAEEPLRPGETPRPPVEPIEGAGPQTNGTIYIVAGEPDAVLEFMGKLTESIFIEAENRGLSPDGRIAMNAAPMVRVGAGLADSDDDLAAALSKVETLPVRVVQEFTIE